MTFRNLCHFPTQALFLDIHIFQWQIFQMQAENTHPGDLVTGS